VAARDPVTTVTMASGALRRDDTAIDVAGAPVRRIPHLLDAFPSKRK
jgi:hypothetical protein